MSNNIWTKEQWRAALDFTRDRDKSADDVAAFFDDAFTALQVQRKFDNMGYRGRLRGINAPRQVPAAVLAERDARYEASLLRTRTQEFFGDPPPGFSALDRKRQGLVP